MEAVCLRRVAACVLAEDSYAAEYVGRDAPVVKNYPVLDRLAEAPRTERKGPGFCYVGGVSETRGATDMIRAFALVLERIPGARLHSRARSIRRCRRRSAGARRDVGRRARLHLERPGVPRRGLPDHGRSGRRAGSLWRVGNYVESLPTKMFEYMSCALPVVVSDFPLWRAIVEDCGCGTVFEPGDVASLADAMTASVSDEPSYARMSEAGLRAVVDRYNWALEADRLLDLYGRIVS